MIGLLVVACAGFLIGAAIGAGALYWACGKENDDNG